MKIDINLEPGACILYPEGFSENGDKHLPIYTASYPTNY